MMERKPKTTFQLDTPYTAVEWPKFSEKDQKLIFELLCNTLAPIGQHRANLVTSKGKKSQKRKRQEAKERALSNVKNDTQDGHPPSPEIQKHVVVGLNSILRHLQSLSQASKSKQPSPAETIPETSQNTPHEPGIEEAKDSIQPQPLAAIFALSPTPANSTILTTHLPTLIHTSSLLHPSLPPTRLIPLSQAQATQLRTVLSLARTSHIGILDSAPGAEALKAVIRENVPVVEVRWLDEVKKGEYLETRINAIETFVVASRKEMREKMQKGEGEEG